jgi:uncharacterized protein YbaP (TraB family)
MEKSLVWQFYKENSDKKHFLIGTMHVRDERAFQHEAYFKEAILKCDVFATELDLDEAASMDMLSVTTYPNGTTLSHLIPKKLYAKIDKVLKKQTGVPLAQFEIFHPIMVTNFFTESLLSNDRWQALDAVLWEFAKENDKILRGVETNEEQLAVLKKMTVEEQLKNLKDLVSNFSKFRKHINHLAQLYEKADISQLYKATKNSIKGGRQMLLYTRNDIMAKRLSEMADTHSVCAAVGAGHLAGQKGVLRLLKKMGFIISPVY